MARLRTAAIKHTAQASLVVATVLTLAIRFGWPAIALALVAK
jgi:hypothetical protein